MEVIYALIPGMIILGLIMVGVLIWAVKKGQFDDLEGEASRILMDDDDPLLPYNGNKPRNCNNSEIQNSKTWPDDDPANIN